MMKNRKLFGTLQTAHRSEYDNAVAEKNFEMVSLENTVDKFPDASLSMRTQKASSKMPSTTAISHEAKPKSLVKTPPHNFQSLETVTLIEPYDMKSSSSEQKNEIIKTEKKTTAKKHGKRGIFGFQSKKNKPSQRRE